METWILPALLGVGLAAATGFRTFLPLLMLGLAARFQLFGTDLAPAMASTGVHHARETRAGRRELSLLCFQRIVRYA